MQPQKGKTQLNKKNSTTTKKKQCDRKKKNTHTHTCSVLRHADKRRFLHVTHCVLSAHLTKTSVWKTYQETVT